MSTIFSRRRVTSNSSVRMPHSSTTAPAPTASAAAAASQAFMKNQQSNASLSAAAAAAALHSHPGNPVPVSEIQTKRMVRRASVSSSGSARDARDARDTARPSSNLRRRGSGGSMTERTFRSPSPVRGRPAVDPDAPPMPIIPKDAPAIPPKSHKRVVSLDTERRASSPGGRGRSLERAIPGMSSATTGARTPTQEPEVTHEGSQKSSVNFSRPMSPTNSPTFAAQIRPILQGGWFSGPIIADAQFRNTPSDRPKTAVGATPSEMSKIQPDLQSVAIRPATPKKKKRPASVDGSHPTKPTMATEVTGTAITSNKKSPAPEQPAIRAAIPSPASTSVDDQSPANSSSESSPVGRQKKPDVFHTRTRAMLTKQPSIVHEQPELEKQTEATPSANTGRKIDASTGRSPNDGVRSTSSTTQPTTASGTSQQQRLAPSSEDQTASGGLTPVPLSPSKTPHFSLVPIELESGRKHQPPPRSVSPVKPALKHSPSSSIRTASPVANPAAAGGGKRTPEESPSRSRSPQQKKSVRVSFDASPVTIISSLETSKHAPANVRVEEEPDFEEAYTPRPALPSFGSIRGRKAVDDTTPVVKPAGSEPSSLSSSQTLVDQRLSKDHAIGGIVAQGFATPQSAEQIPVATEPTPSRSANNLPLPPVVTTVEGTGYGSDSGESSYAQEQEPIRSSEEAPTSSTQKQVVASIQPIHEQSKPERVETEAIEKTSQHEPDVVPAVSVRPPTPDTEADDADDAGDADDADDADEALFIVPGAFPAWESSAEVNKQGLVEQEMTNMQNEPPHSIEPLPSSAPAPTIFAEPSITHTAPTPDEDSDSDNNSIYSDAAEDPSELFTSINAIVESPIGLSVATDHAAPASSPQTSPVQIPHTSEEKEFPTAAEWHSATKYWRGLGEENKQEIELSATNNNAAAEDEAMEEESAFAQPLLTPPKPKKKKKTSTLQTEPESVITPALHQVQAPSASRQYHAVAEQKHPAIRKSMRTQHEQQNNVEHQHTIPKTLRQPKSGLSASRYAPQEPRGALQKKHFLAAKTPPTPVQKFTAPAPSPKVKVTPLMQRRGSADSDSSFKRHRASASSGKDRSLRRTLRQQPPPTSSQTPTHRAQSSPASPPASPPPRQMLTSLRQSVDADTPSLGIKKKSKRSALSPSRFPGFRRSGKDKAKPGTAATPSLPRFRSRFAADSDDEDEDSPTQIAQVMESRFADSDDELDDLTPVRGIPRRAGDDDQISELLPGEDEPSDDSDVPPIPGSKEMEIATALARERLAARGVIANGKAQGSALAAGTLRDGDVNGLATSKYAPSAGVDADQTPSRKSKWSLFSLSGRKADQRKREGNASPLPSSSFGDARPESSSGSGPSSPLRGLKLRRRPRPTGLPPVSEDSWPLPPPPVIDADDEDRPNTSEGAVVVGGGDGADLRLGDRPDGGKRSSTASIEPVYSQRTGKAKKFMRLRKAFGLGDRK